MRLRSNIIGKIEADAAHDGSTLPGARRLVALRRVPVRRVFSLIAFGGCILSLIIFGRFVPDVLRIDFGLQIPDFGLFLFCFSYFSFITVWYLVGNSRIFFIRLSLRGHILRTVLGRTVLRRLVRRLVRLRRRRIVGGRDRHAVGQPDGLYRVLCRDAELYAVEGPDRFQHILVLHALDGLDADMILHKGAVPDLAHGGDVGSGDARPLEHVAQEHQRLPGHGVFPLGVALGRVPGDARIIGLRRRVRDRLPVIQRVEVILHLEAVVGVALGGGRVPQLQRGFGHACLHGIGGDFRVLHRARQHDLAVQIHIFIKHGGLRLRRPLLIAGVRVLMLLEPALQRAVLSLARPRMDVRRIPASGLSLQRIRFKGQLIQRKEQHKDAQHRDDALEPSLLVVLLDLFPDLPVVLQQPIVIGGQGVFHCDTSSVISGPSGIRVRQTDIK